MVVELNELLLPLIDSYQGHIGAYLVLGGVDNTGPHLLTIHAHGSTDKLPYVSMGEYTALHHHSSSFTVLIMPSCVGSGSLAAMAVFEDRYKPNLEVTQVEVHLLTTPPYDIVSSQ